MIGERLGPYRVVRELGRGGMGSVWIGEHAELGHRVALKVLLPEVGRDPDAVQRFFNEARAAARVRNPGIVQIVDFGRGDDGAPYLAMELLSGQSLRQRIRDRAPLPADEAATIARQIATTLAAAHAAGIVHRDLKPDNVMLVPDPEVASGERTKVLDFGIAKLLADPGPATLTRAGSLLGTPHYMAPEQCRGTGEIDARADVYALGCILFEMICGRPPFASPAVGEVVGMHQFVAPPAPSSLRADLPEALEAVIVRCLGEGAGRPLPDDGAARRGARGGRRAGGADPAAERRRGGDDRPRGDGGDAALRRRAGAHAAERR